MIPCDTSVIIPVLHEKELINTAVEFLEQMESRDRIEIIVVDGDPNEQTLRAIQSSGIRKLYCEKGRGRQMNAGARVATGDILLFLHADTRLPRNGLDMIGEVMQDSRYVGGSFDLGIQSNRLCFRLIERAASLRSRITRVPYGDQAIFLRKEFFIRLGGFRELPLMEDVDLMLRVRRSGARIHIIHEKVETSARRWEKEGVLFCTLRNWALAAVYLLGVSPQRLARFYKQDR